MAHNGKHWTFDCGTVNTQSHYADIPSSDLLIPGTGGSANTIPAFLIRPISRNSLRSSNCQGQGDKRSLSISPKALEAAVAAASSSVTGTSKERTFISKSDKDVYKNGEHNFASNYNYQKRHASCRLHKRIPSAYGDPQNDEKEDKKNTTYKGNIELRNNGNLFPAPLTSGYESICFEDPLKGNRLHLQRQHSDAGAYGLREANKIYLSSNCGKIGTKHRALMEPVVNAKVMKSSHSHPGIAMLRDNSCSLVDIPTYLGPSLQACGGVELLTVSTQETGTTLCKPTPAINPTPHTTAILPPMPSHSNVQDQSITLSSTNKKNNYGQETLIPPSTLPIDIGDRQKQELREKQKLKKQKKAKWTVLCVSLALLTMCIALVGTMLSLGSKYQVMSGHVASNYFLIFNHA